MRLWLPDCILVPLSLQLSGYEAALPITEKSNPLTQDLDKADAEQIVRLLGQCDAEIFQEEGQIMPTYQVTQTHALATENKDTNSNHILTSALSDHGP